MKTMTKIYKTLGLLPISVAALMLTACSNEDFTTEIVQAATKTIPYVVTVTNSDATDTRATVDNDNKTLYFAEGDKLYITGTNIQGVLDITDGKGTASATFKGELAYTGDNAPGDDLALTATLVSAQQTIGTEVSVDANGAVTVNYPTTAFCADVATAVQKYSNLTGTGTLSSKTFALSQQTAFLNFAITLDEGTATATDVTAKIENGTKTLSTATVTTKTVGSDVTAGFVLPVAMNTVLKDATAYIDGKGVNFVSSTEKALGAKVYNVNRTLTTCDVSTWVENPTEPVGNGAVLTGVLAGNYYVSIADGATVTLNNVTINGVNDNSYLWAGITCLGDATIILKGNNTVKGFKSNYPGIFVDVNKTLTIDGDGSLNASSNGGAAGIGGGYDISCGNIIINGGTVIATGTNRSAGIGCGFGSSSVVTCGNITINDGDITVQGGLSGAGIGSGDGGGSSQSSSTCGNITINGGNINATGGIGGAGIGSGEHNGKCGNITISSGTIIAMGGTAGAGIGSGNDFGNCGNIIINGGNITATGVNMAAGIGTGSSGECGDITITSDVTKVTATKGATADYSIGNGNNGPCTCGTVTIGSTVYWQNDAAVGDGATYLATSPLFYEPQP